MLSTGGDAGGGEEPSEAAASQCLRRLAEGEGDRLFVDDPRLPLTYREFDQLADRVAAGLLERLGAGEHPVAVHCRDLSCLSVATLGVTRSGKTVACVDPAAPDLRVHTLLSDLDAPIVVSDSDGPEIDGRPAVHPLRFGPPGFTPPPVSAPQVASIHYTSGSTGLPKGVMIPTAARDALGAGLALMDELRGARIPYFAGNSWGDALVHGALIAEVTLVPYDIVRIGIPGLPSWLRDNDIRVLPCVPTLLRALIRSASGRGDLSQIKLIISNGETLHWSDVARLRRHMHPDLVLINMFALTESGTVAVNVITPDTPTGIGPVPPAIVLPSVDIEIVGEDGSVLPPDTTGEIVATSATVMLGYWRRPELTARVLTSLPDGRRRLRTGDAGRLSPSGALVHLGRIDHVVKVSGRRIELGEVEVALCRLDEVVAAAAATYEDDAGHVRLVAFVTPAAVAQPSPAGLRSGLARLLPAGMLPDRIVIVDELPQLPSGKVDRLSLPNPIGPDAAVPGHDGLVASLVGLWAKTLDRSDVGADADFFMAGGDSIRVASLFALIAEQLGHDRPAAILIDHPTPRLLAAALEAEADLAGELFSFNLDGPLPPLIVIHDGSGDVVYARRLATELGPEQPVYAIRGVGLDGKRLQFQSIEALAEHYIELVTPFVSLDRPLRLCGFSAGGLIAFEMALQLERKGTRVELLAACDTLWPGALTYAPSQPRAAQLRATLRKRRWSSVPKVILDHLRWRLESVSQRRTWARLTALDGAGTPIPVADRYQYALYQYGRLAERYRPDRTFSGSVLLLRADGWEEVPDRGWSAHIDGKVVIADLGCTHADACREAGMPGVAAALAACPEGHRRAPTRALSFIQTRATAT